jgi:hypothetical protein
VDARTSTRLLRARLSGAGPLAAVAYELVTPVDAGRPSILPG